MNLKNQQFVMRYNFLIVLIFLSFFKMNAQQTLSVEEYHDYVYNHRDLPSTVTRIIDSNNTFDKFIGSWGGSLNGLDYYFYVSKFSDSDDIYDEYESLEVRYLITQGSTIIADTRQELSLETSMFLFTMPNTQTAHFSVIDEDRCNGEMIGAFHLVGSPSSGSVLGEVFNEMQVAFSEVPGFFVENWCPNGPTPNQFPKDVIITLTKQ